MVSKPPSSNNKSNSDKLSQPESLKPNSIVDMLKTVPIIKAKPIQILRPEESDCNQTQLVLQQCILNPIYDLS